MKLARYLLILSSLTLGFGLSLSGSAHAYANTPPIDSAYNSRIIDDSIFLNSNTMSTQDIQNFLNSKVPTCDTNHQGGLPQYPPPYTCLKDYVDPTTGKTAAALIHDEAVAVGLNPQVVLVTLEKEQSLVTDTWPYPSQYKSAMGYGCPESQDVCDSQYYGFYNQVHLGVRLLRAGEARDCGDTSTLPGWYVDPKWQLGNTPVVDGRSTYLSTCATGSLYNYTPHRPDSAYTPVNGTYYYGNYNFINFFTSWFGPTFGAKVIQAPGDSRLFLLDGNVKHWISTTEVYSAWALSSSPAVQVSQSYFDSIPTGPELTRYIQAPSGAVYYIDNGHKHWVTSSTYLQLWNIPNSQIVPATAMQNLLPETEWIGRFAKSLDGSTVYLIDGSTKHKLPTATDQYHWGLTPNNYTFLSADALAHFTNGPDLGEKVSSAGNNYVVDASHLLTIPDSQTAAAWGLTSFISLNTITTSLLGTPIVASNFVEDPSAGAWYLLTAGSKRYIPNGAIATAWGFGVNNQSMTFISSNLLSTFPAAANLSLYVQDATSSKDYVIDGTKNWLPDSNTFNAWLPNGATVPIYDSNSLARLTERSATSIIQPNGSNSIYALDHGSKLYIQTGAILSAWGVPSTTQIEPVSASLAASLSTGSNASQYVSNSGTTYFLDNGIKRSVPTNLTTDWAATTPVAISAEALARFGGTSAVLPFVSFNGAYYALTSGRTIALGGYPDAYGASPTTATPLTNNIFSSSGATTSYIAQSVSSQDSRMWLVTGGSKYYFDNFARLASYGFVSRGIPVTFLSQSLLDSLPVQSGMAPLCITKPGAGIKYLNFGAAMGFPDGATITAYCATVTTVSPSIYDSFSLAGTLSRIVKDDSGKIYFIDSGTKRWIASSATYNSTYRSYPVTYLYGTTMSLIADGQPIN